MFATVYSALFSRMFCLLHGIQRCAFLSDTLCVVGVDAGNAVTPSTGPPTSDGVLYILHMGDGTIPTVRKN